MRPSAGTSKAFVLLSHSAIKHVDGGSGMNTDQLKGNWKQIVGKAKEKWGKLTDNDWKVVEGKRDQLVGRIQERYGIAREEAERQVSGLRENSRENLDQPLSHSRHPACTAAIHGIDGVSALGCGEGIQERGLNRDVPLGWVILKYGTAIHHSLFW